MKFGISTFVTDEGIAPGALARAIEERGFDSLFVAEHTHIPLSRKSPWPRGGELPRRYYRTLDPLHHPHRRCRCNGTPAARHGGSLGSRARPDHYGQGSREPGSRIWRTSSLRRRCGLEPRGDGESRHRPRGRSTNARMVATKPDTLCTPPRVPSAGQSTARPALRWPRSSPRQWLIGIRGEFRR